MFPASLSKHFSSLTDVRKVPLPWEFLKHISLEILRAGAEEAVQARKERESRNEVVDSLVRSSLRATLADTIAQEGEAEHGKAGFRAKRRATRQQKRQRDAARIETIVNQAVDAVPIDKLREQDDLNDDKPYVAKTVTKGWPGVTDTGEPGAAPLEPTLANKLYFYGWRGVLVQHDGKDHFLKPEEFANLDPNGELALAVAAQAATVTHFEGNPRDAEGNLVWVDADQPYGDQPLGDALTEFALDSSEAGDEYKAVFDRRAVSTLPATPAGSTGT